VDATPLLPAVECEPSAGPATAAVIWLHGLGADGHDFEPVVPLMRLPHARFVFPHAPRLRVTINFGMMMPAWYDILTLEPGSIREDGAHVAASAARIAARIDHERARGIPTERIVLAGFSQGGAMAAYVAARYPARLAGVMCLSAYPLLPARWDGELQPANAQTPALVAHGVHDPMVPLAGGRALAELLRSSAPGTPARDVQWHEFPIEHSVSPQELEVIGAWLRARLPAQASG
jgi:phospholipase/carboxylesterase